MLRYDIDGTKFHGKRLRWSGMVRGLGLKLQAYLFAAAESDSALTFAQSFPLTKAENGWVRRECVLDIPADAGELSMGLWLEGGGRASVRHTPLNW